MSPENKFEYSETENLEVDTVIKEKNNESHSNHTGHHYAHSHHNEGSHSHHSSSHSRHGNHHSSRHRKSSHNDNKSLFSRIPYRVDKKISRKAMLTICSVVLLLMTVLVVTIHVFETTPRDLPGDNNNRDIGSRLSTCGSRGF